MFYALPSSSLAISTGLYLCSLSAFGLPSQGSGALNEGPAVPPARSTQASSTGVESLWGDWNADGRRDLLLVESGRVRLFEDAEGLGFREVTVEAGLDRWNGLTSVLWSDLDGDGAPDLLLARAQGEGAFLAGLCEGGWKEPGSVVGLDLARPLTRVRSVGDAGAELLLEGPGGLHFARFTNGRGWSEFELSSASTRGAVVTNAADLHGRGLGANIVVSATGQASAGGLAIGAQPTPGPSSASISNGTGTLLNPVCARFLLDFATNQCLSASSLPGLGQLYPLTVNFNVTQTGNVGIGTITPAAKLDVLGTVRGQQLISTANGLTPPLVVSSGAKVANLNADKLDGVDSSAFSQLGNSIEGSEITVGTISADRLANPLTASGTGAVTLRASSVGLASTAIRGESSGGSGNVGVRGESTSTSGSAFGVRGITASTTGKGISGEATSSSGANVGVYASTASTDGTAIQAVASSTIGSTFGVQATNAATQGIGVYGLATRTGPYLTYGVVGETNSEEGIGVRGRSTSLTATSSGGVSGETYGPGGAAVFGVAQSTTGFADAIVGVANSPIGYGVLAVGALGATGTKSFVQPHPLDSSKQLRFVCLEGNESGTYFRGTTELVGGQARIEVPEEFRLVSEDEGLTVQLTPRGPGILWIESVDLESIVVRGDATGCDYFVNGVRRGFGDVDVVQENRLWVPQYRGVPFGTQYPEGVRRILVENGTLNADFTPNESMAQVRGWRLRDPESNDSLSRARANAIESLPVAESEVGSD